jgi:hypothetical protein
MKLLELELANIGGAPDGRYRFGAQGADEPAPLTLVTAGTAGGKTSFLHAIAAAKELVGPYGIAPRAARLLRRGAAAGRIVGRWRFDEAERAFLGDAPPDGDARFAAAEAAVAAGAEAPEPPPRIPAEPVATIAIELSPSGAEVTPPRRFGALFSRYDRSAAVAKLELFPADRAIRAGMWREPSGSQRAFDEAAPRLTAQPAKYGFARRFLAQLFSDNSRRLDELRGSQGLVTSADNVDAMAPAKRAIAALAPALRLKRVEPRDGGDAEVWLSRRAGPDVELDDLSAAESYAVLFALTWLRQGLTRSLVLVDRPDLHVGRERASGLLKSLSELCPDGQIIAASDAPELLEGVAGAHVIDLRR